MVKRSCGSERLQSIMLSLRANEDVQLSGSVTGLLSPWLLTALYTLIKDGRITKLGSHISLARNIWAN